MNAERRPGGRRTDRVGETHDDGAATTAATSVASIPGIADRAPCRVAGCEDPGCRHQAAAGRVARRRRIAKVMGRRRTSRLLDELLGQEAEKSTIHGWLAEKRNTADFGHCTGEHHPDLGCDWWGPCSGAAYTLAEHRRLRAGVAA